MEKVIITAALTGAFPAKDKNPNIPLTPQEIADDVYEVWKAGAAIAHLHMVDDNGNGTMDLERYKETLRLINEKNIDIILNLTTSGDLNATDETRMAHIIEIKPEIASFDAGTMNWMNKTVFYNTPPFLEKLGKTMLENGVKPEVEIFDAGMLYNTLYYVKKGIVAEPTHYQFVLGAAGGTAATVENLVYLKSLLPENCTWSAFGIGKGHMPVLYTTLALGGHIRVGLEDNIYYSKGRLAKSNAEFVERAVRVVKEFGKEPATPNEAREILGLKRGVTA
ncbi:3-keto-5-aminohexanoate cleavage protein [Bacillus sp. FJAT-18017]|uniref:3-keto-5-aminohexanoate cleavage protein n=1 Tax=Bacillus sp. FJAT-18017 TaxID=1705566 RepID=UPI0006ADDC04|nr:3-keto-5-aminohexanoate cleavage protein [Bacillus sp. FJAT-18017]ALC89243.1 3-keto-5-aminohexanoate cleavage protein [Bacillus sp. FJAT-18017]